MIIFAAFLLSLVCLFLYAFTLTDKPFREIKVKDLFSLKILMSHMIIYTLWIFLLVALFFFGMIGSSKSSLVSEIAGEILEHETGINIEKLTQAHQ